MGKEILIDKIITAVYLSSDKTAIKFDFDGGDVLSFAEGECCSYSWIEHVENPENLIGASVLSVVDKDMPDLGDQPDHDCMSYYGLEITTAKGYCLIDYRNDSNGYYGGCLVWPEDWHHSLYLKNHTKDWGKIA